MNLKAFGGPIQILRINETTGEKVVTQVKPHNLVLYSGSEIVARLLAGQTNYNINTMYFEFVNSTSAYTPPTFTSAYASGKAYYNELTGINDYIRTPITVTPSLQNSGDTGYLNNLINFYGQITAAIGNRSVSPLTFSDSANSKVVGAALVSSPTGNIADDIVYARFYYPTPDVKLAGHQCGVVWPVNITLNV